jgi:hypothetical protein
MLNPALRPYMRMTLEDTCWEFQAACFGLNVLPEKFMSLMKCLEKRWRAKGLLYFVYLDDILLIGDSQKQVSNHLAIMLADLLQGGFKINSKKSILQPTQNLPHLGFHLNLAQGKLQLGTEKLKMVRRELGKLVTHQSLSCRKMASILGCIRSFLVGLPFLRAFTDTLVGFVNLHEKFRWDHQVPIQEEVKTQLQDVREILQTWGGRPFPSPATRHLESDSSTFGWGGLDLQAGTQLQEFWRKDSHLHINVKELIAAISTLRSLARKKDTVSLTVDNKVSYYYLLKGGGRLPHLNKLIRPFLKWCMEMDITLQVHWAPSQSMKSDAISRWHFDPGDYSLNPFIFKKVMHIFQHFINPTVDMFASPGNHKLPQFLSRCPHF